MNTCCTRSNATKTALQTRLQLLATATQLARSSLTINYDADSDFCAPLLHQSGLAGVQQVDAADREQFASLLIPTPDCSQRVRRVLAPLHRRHVRLAQTPGGHFRTQGPFRWECTAWCMSGASLRLRCDSGASRGAHPTSAPATHGWFPG